MADALALYRLVMGETWDEEQRRAGAMREQAAPQGRFRRAGGAAQGGRRRQVGKALPRSVMMAASGSRAAIFKRIRAGGCKTRASLTAQLDYINDKALFVTSTMTNALSGRDQLSAEEKAEIVEDWAATWKGTTKLGFTSHMLLSFPVDTDAADVRNIAMDWCEHFFESGCYGDEWDYVLAIHTDRAHPHAHVVLNNRGRDQGEWFSCWEGGVMSPQLMREKQAEIAGQYGVALDATTRLERGIFMKPAGLEEIYAAKAEGRRASEIAMTDQERAIATAAVVGFAKEYRSIAEALDRSDRSHLAQLVRQMAKDVEAGRGAGLSDRGAIDMKDIQSVGDAMAYAEVRLEQIAAWRDGLHGAERVAYELQKAPYVEGFSQTVPDAEMRTCYGADLDTTYPPGAETELPGSVWSDGERTPAMDAALETARDVGLDPDEQRARLELGGTRNAGLAQDWVDRDVDAVLRHAGVDPETATMDDKRAAWVALDDFNDRIADQVAELERARGIEVEVFDAIDARRGEVVPFPGQGAQPTPTDDAVETIAAEHKTAANRQVLTDLAVELRQRPSHEMTGRADLAALTAVLEEEIGDEGLTALRRGETDRLRDVLPNDLDRVSVAQEYVAGLAARTGDETLVRQAGQMQQDKIDAIVDERIAARAASMEAMPGGAWADAGDETRSSERAEATSSYLQTLADQLRDGGLSQPEEDSLERTLETELFNELGTEGVAELKIGHWDVLADVLPNKVDQIAVTQEYLGVVAERTGDETYDARAAELQQDKIDAIVAERIAERSVRPGRGFELDDDMEF